MFTKVIFLARAGLDGMSSTDELWFDFACVACALAYDLFLPIWVHPHPPLWMAYVQPLIVVGGVVWVYRKSALRHFRPFKRTLVCCTAFCLLMFITNMAGNGRMVWPLASDIVNKAILIGEGKGAPSDMRP